MASLEEIREGRLKKLELLKSKGHNPYPIKSNKTHSLKEISDSFDSLSGVTVTLLGRVLSYRGQGSVIFLNFTDGTGRFQAMLKKDSMDEESFDLFTNVIDMGDFVEFTGLLMTTKTGEKTIFVNDWKILAKSLRPLPDKWHGLQDTEERFRKRYLDSLMEQVVYDRFVTRSKIIKSLRNFLDQAGFLEVETSILQALAGGATATPFITHHQALDLDLFLRVAPELDLKKIMIGGFPMVYELGRCFRNEGIDTTHNPEFTMLEAYTAFSDASKERLRVEKLFKNLVKDIFGQEQFNYNDQIIDTAKPFEVLEYADVLAKYTGIDNILELGIDDLKQKAEELGLKIDPSYPAEKIIDHIYKKVCRPNIIQPTFLINYPVAFAPLAKRKENNQDLIDRFQLVIGGVELVNGFSELNDPIDQRQRFMEQEKNKQKGDNEAQPKDEEFLEAMEYGMPPACGWGIGIDRLTMLLTDTQNIKEVIYFPTLRPRE